MERLAPTLFAVALVVAFFLLIWLGWRGRLKRQSDVTAPAEVPTGLGTPVFASPGSYVSTTSEGDWLDRIAVHGLGIRGEAALEVHPTGIAYLRRGAPDLYIPLRDIRGVRTASGMAGKFVERDGLVVVTWMLGATSVDTGFRTRAAADRSPLVQAIAALVPEKTS